MWKYISLLVVLTVQATLVTSTRPFLMRECDPGGSDRLGSINNLQVSPDPIRSPGQITVSVNGSIGRSVPAGGIDVRLRVQKDALAWVTMPCINNLGSCTYDFCTLLPRVFQNHTCPYSTNSTSAGPCTCDQLVPGDFAVNNMVIPIPDVRHEVAWSLFALGDYRVDVTLLDRATQSEIYCLHLELTLKDPKECKGFLCHFFG
ncbi:unnamed protein product [Lymnaea stagnalis]|uniref:MD-2-related lipid-recognition domain-containing protein n=1 Tax=Lymnaea stagnalis TaxID=6523 RepID=A0AAV2HDN2_LYMST